jgi:N-acetylglucosamine kinase-like BadF-type ATPase
LFKNLNYMSFVLGIDGGGSKTICVLMDDKSTVLGRGESGPSNYQTVGIPATLRSIESAIYTAVNQALNFADTINIKAICLGLAGVSRPRDLEVVNSIFQELQNSEILPITWEQENIVICNDALIALVGGIGDDVGVVVAAGTGSIVFGRNHQGDTKRVGGWGYILGDEGSAYKIAIAGLQAAMKSYDGREISTSLVAGFQQHLNFKNMEDLIEAIYSSRWGVKEIAALAPVVDYSAAAGDKLANSIIDDAVQDLFLATSTVIDAVFPQNPSLQVEREIKNNLSEVVTTGSVWRGKSRIWERFEAAIVVKYPAVKVIFPRFEPAVGAGLLALKRLTGVRFQNHGNIS